ncbi:hypothetical protein D3C80_1554320 [compost metagenome]
MVEELFAFYKALIRVTGNSYTFIIGSGNALRLNHVLCEQVGKAFGMPFAFSLSIEEAAVGAALSAAAGGGFITGFREAGQYIGVDQPE